MVGSEEDFGFILVVEVGWGIYSCRREGVNRFFGFEESGFGWDF